VASASRAECTGLGDSVPSTVVSVAEHGGQVVSLGLSEFGWVDIVILVILVVAFLRGRRLFFPILALILMVYLFRIFPNEILGIIRGINQLNGPAAFITISR